MLDKLAALVDPTARTTDTTVAGVRGNLIGDQSSGDMTWESDNADVDAIMTSAQQLVRDKHYAEAAENSARLRLRPTATRRTTPRTARLGLSRPTDRLPSR